MNNSQLDLYYSEHTSYYRKRRWFKKMTSELMEKFEEYAEKTSAYWIESALKENT
jgi:hypothetical protein